MAQTTVYKEWLLFGVIPIWRVTRALNEKELRERAKIIKDEISQALKDEILENKKAFQDEIKEKVLNEIGLALREPTQAR
jgi:hypothetical protein